MSVSDSSVNLVMTVCETGVDDLDCIYKHTKYKIANQNMRNQKNVPELMQRDYNFVAVNF